MSYSNRKKGTAMMKELRRREAADHAPRMSIVYRAVDQLKLDPANARRHSKKQIRQIAQQTMSQLEDAPMNGSFRRSGRSRRRSTNAEDCPKAAVLRRFAHLLRWLSVRD
jgi:hypothetical protein